MWSAVNCVSRTATVHGDRPRTGIKRVARETDVEMNVFNFVLGPAERLCALHSSPPTTDASGEMRGKKQPRQSDGGLSGVTIFVNVPRSVNPFSCLAFIERFTEMHIKEGKNVYRTTVNAIQNIDFQLLLLFFSFSLDFSIPPNS